MGISESPKNRFTGFAPGLNNTQIPRPGCVQCGSVTENSDRKKTFSGKCVSCEYWISDEEEEVFDDLEY